MTPSPGDTLITLRTVGPLRRGDVVTVASTCADGEYLYFDGHERQAFRSDAFLVAVRCPWWAWAEPGWAERARAAAEGFVREGIPATACADHGARTSVTSYGTYCVACGDRIEFPVPSPAPVATEARPVIPETARIALMLGDVPSVMGESLAVLESLPYAEVQARHLAAARDTLIQALRALRSLAAQETSR